MQYECESKKNIVIFTSILKNLFNDMCTCFNERPGIGVKNDGFHRMMQYYQ